MHSSSNNSTSCKHKLNCFYLEKNAFRQPFKEKENKNIQYLSEACASQACLKVKENIEAAPHVAPFFSFSLHYSLF